MEGGRATDINRAMSETPAVGPRPAAPADRRALAALFAGACGIAFAPIFVRLSELPPTATAVHRFALAVPVLWAWLAIADALGGVQPPPTCD